MSRTPYSPVREERVATRMANDSDLTCAVVLPDQRDPILAEVHDESLGGLGLLFNDQIPLALGQEVSIVFAASVFTASLLHVERQPDGRYLAGFCCT